LDIDNSIDFLLDEIIAEQGFVTVLEPACGAGGMIIAAADVIERRGFDIARQLYVDATDLSPTCFKMSYLQASLGRVRRIESAANFLVADSVNQIACGATW
jgi:hypothetical protein